MTEIRRAMLRIRRERSQIAAQLRVDALLKQQEEDAAKRMGQSADEKTAGVTSSSSATTTTTTAGPSVSFQDPQSRFNVSVQDNGGPSLDQDEKYQLYLNWLTETQQHQRRGTVTERPRGRSHSMQASLLGNAGATSQYPRHDEGPCDKCCAGCSIM
jgi:malate synthase